MATYGELKELIRRDIERTDINTNGNALLSDDSITYYIKAAIDFYKTEEFSFNQASATLTITADSETVEIPNDFAKFIFWRRTTAGYEGYFELVPYDEIEHARVTVSVSGNTPLYFSIFNGNLEVFPKSTVNIATKFSYVKAIDYPVNDGDGGAWVNEARHLIAAKARAYIFANVLRDIENAALAQSMADSELKKLQERNINYNSIGKVRYASWL